MWSAAARDWEFTGEDVIAHCGDVVRWRIPIRSITGTKLTRDRGGLWLDIISDGHRYNIKVVADLKTYIEKQKAYQSDGANAAQDAPRSSS